MKGQAKGKFMGCVRDNLYTITFFRMGYAGYSRGKVNIFECDIIGRCEKKRFVRTGTIF